MLKPKLIAFSLAIFAFISLQIVSLWPNMAHAHCQSNDRPSHAQSYDMLAPNLPPSHTPIKSIFKSMSCCAVVVLVNDLSLMSAHPPLASSVYRLLDSDPDGFEISTEPRPPNPY
jgi:hypothetical protein